MKLLLTKAVVQDPSKIYVDLNTRKMLGVKDGDFVSISTDTAMIVRQVARVPRDLVGATTGYISDSDFESYLGLMLDSTVEAEIGPAEVSFAFPAPIF